METTRQAYSLWVSIICGSGQERVSCWAAYSTGCDDIPRTSTISLWGVVSLRNCHIWRCALVTYSISTTSVGALALHGKNFHMLQRFVKTKSTKEIIEFYYVWYVLLVLIGKIHVVIGKWLLMEGNGKKNLCLIFQIPSTKNTRCAYISPFMAAMAVWRRFNTLFTILLIFLLICQHLWFQDPSRFVSPRTLVKRWE